MQFGHCRTMPAARPLASVRNEIVYLGFSRKEPGPMNNCPAIAALLLALLSTPALAQVPPQQHVCQEDAFRLCQAAIPDHQRIFVCLLENQQRLSAACRALIASAVPRDDGRGGARPRRGANPD